MKCRFIFIAALLCTLNVLAQYNPRFFGCRISFKKATVITGMIIDMHGNPPLYFTLPDGTRDYVKDILLNISQQKKGEHVTYNIDYIIHSYNNSYDLSTKGTAADTVEPILNKTFPQLFSAQGTEREWCSLRSLRNSKENVATFKKAVDLINAFVPAKLNYDEKDFMKLEFYEWRSWFSVDSWRNWFAYRKE